MTNKTALEKIAETIRDTPYKTGDMAMSYAETALKVIEEELLSDESVEALDSIASDNISPSQADAEQALATIDKKLEEL